VKCIKFLISALCVYHEVVNQFAFLFSYICSSKITEKFYLPGSIL